MAWAGGGWTRAKAWAALWCAPALLQWRSSASAMPEASAAPPSPTAPPARPLRAPPALQEIRRVWLGMLSQCDAGLGQKLAAKLQAQSAL